MQRYEDHTLGAGATNSQAGPMQDWERAAAMRNAAALRNAKDRGLATPGMVEHATAGPGVNPYAVNELPLEIQNMLGRVYGNWSPHDDTNNSPEF